MINFSESVYRQNNLICMLQDLKNLFVYWDLRPERINTLNCFLSNIKPGASIKLSLLSDNSGDPPQVRQEITLANLEPGNYYFQNIDPEFNYYFELGMRDNDNKFILFASTPTLELHPSRLHSANSARSSELIAVPFFFGGEYFTELTSSWS